ncbi:MAG: NTP transferase domain-containing protein [Trueperaceae bacterium]
MTSVRDENAGPARAVTASAEEAVETPLYGLVLAGGKSTRMGRPKWALEYHGEPHAVVLYRLASSFCQRTFLSIRPEQAEEPALARLPHIADRFPGMGPLGGILSAMSEYPKAAWLVLACDLPFVEASTVQTLLDKRLPRRHATSFMSPHDGLPEPLCAIYEPSSRLRLIEGVDLGYRCPRKMLMNSSIQLVESARPEELTNANNPHEFEQAVARLRAGGEH